MIAELLRHPAFYRQFERLQWGRDQMIAELYRRRPHEAIFCHASMGPRSNDRGILLPLAPVALPAWLQWGRDQMIAELQIMQVAGDVIFSLQWGRDQMIAEFLDHD